MYYYLLQWDHRMFLWINHWPHTPVLNSVALTLSGIGMGGLVWLVFSLLIFFRVEKKEHWFFLPIVVTTTLSLFITEFFLKNFFARNRPPGSLLFDYSFPSGHATFAWAFAIVLSAKQPRLKYAYYFLAFLISLSRVYLGKHYPADIIAGSIVGLAIGWISLWVERLVIQYRHAQIKRKGTSHRARR